MTLKQLYDHFPEWSLETGLIIVHLDGEEFFTQNILVSMIVLRNPYTATLK